MGETEETGCWNRARLARLQWQQWQFIPITQEATTLIVQNFKG